MDKQEIKLEGWNGLCYQHYVLKQGNLKAKQDLKHILENGLFDHESFYALQDLVELNEKSIKFLELTEPLVMF
ncbi:hypothetical protein Syn7502_03394 [Synechococcus sp. PCC 7502]|uniref:hypothetical protein n=1 Tax=Synechococcus sp. PCC 7502 TaxID=1173263 RepID=UPI00029FF4A1|nr:hypothetical protein [Synechococcus sp. PCC 7502]AFY75246.1 hypothetical protein Syn7502_03394 [Synechococcus sp. PCC 7502]